MSDHRARQHSTRNIRILVAMLHILCLILLALSLYVRTLPPTPTPIPPVDSAEARLWGVWSFTYLPAPVLYVSIAIILGTIVIPWLLELGISSSSKQGFTLAPSLSGRRLIAISLLLFISFYLFPIVHTRWGDAYILSQSISWPDPALRLTHSWQAPLDVFLHSRAWLLLHQPLAWADATPTYRLLSPVAGAFYLIALLCLSRQHWFANQWLPYGLLATLGVLQLFYGYIENYSFAAAGILFYLWLSIGVLRGETPLWQATLVLAVTNATHPSTVILAPSLLYLAWQVLDKRVPTETLSGNLTGNQSRLAIVLQMGIWEVALPMGLVLLATIGLMEAGGHGINALLSTDRPGGSDARWFVPLWETSTRWEHYTMFSWAHLRDLLNEQLLVAPVVWASILITSIYHRLWRGASHKDSVARFLWIAALSYLLFTWVWNPDYGGQRDWDLFSLASIPAALLSAHLLAREFATANAANKLGYNRGNRHLLQGALPLILVQGLYTLSWIHQNTLPWGWP